MGWTLRELLRTIPAVMEDRFCCPTGKQPFPTKRAARVALRKINPKQRTAMCAFRCGYCERYHLGHRRGRII